jgi:hypothetical protein
VKDRPDGCLDELNREAEAPDRRLWVEFLERLAWSGASDAARRDAIWTVHRARSPAGDVEKSAGLELDAQALDVQQWDAQALPLMRSGTEALCTPGAARYEGQSCAGLAFVGVEARPAAFEQ